VLVGFTALAFALFPELAFARPGGGDAFSGGSRGGGGGGDGDIGLVIELVILCVRYPPLGALVVGCLVVYWVVKRAKGSALPDWSVGVPQKEIRQTRAANVARSALDRVRANDPAFSIVLLEDFLYTLYAEVQVHRGGNQLARLAPYIDESVGRALFDPQLEAVFGVVVGAMRHVDFAVHPDRVELATEFEVNLSERRVGRETRLYALDRVRFVRSIQARSRPPARARKLDCPNCGAPLESMRGTTCGYCQQHVGGGRLDWLVTRIDRLRTEPRGPLVTGEVHEQGNQLPTIVDPNAQRNLDAIRQKDPAFDPQALFARTNLVFHELQVGWTARDLPRIRGYVTDNLFQYFGYWIDVYTQARAKNVTENARIVNIELANVLCDAYYDSVTLRVFATGLDYVVGDDGKLLRGSKTRERPYSEYWTLVRGSATRGKPRAEPACPNCGAPLKVGMAGNCEYCHAKVVSGDFDWVLSRIEQDEAYAG
jgi:hypothetical protein